jgi:hypothetical protein
MTIDILPSALNDLADGWGFTSIRVKGLGTYFLDSLFSDIDSLKLYAGIHRKVFGCHRCLSKRFPWFIYYTTESDKVFVKAVLDCRKDPEWIKTKIVEEQ